MKKKKLQIDIHRSGNITEAHVMILGDGIYCSHGMARRHPKDDDVPFIGALQAVTRAVTNGVAAYRITPGEARQVIAFLSGGDLTYPRIGADLRDANTPSNALCNNSTKDWMCILPFGHRGKCYVKRIAHEDPFVLPLR